jgi:hypothetical protein
MKKKITLKTCGAILATLFIQNTSAQSIVDISGGASTMDNYFTNLAYRQQINDNFRVGFEIQYGSPKYRFVAAKPFEKGYAWSLSVPLSFKIAEQDRIIGKLTREVADLQESKYKRECWLEDAKREAGYSNKASFVLYAGFTFIFL